MTGYCERDIVATIAEALDDMPVVVISGIRQTGKSTFLKKQYGLKDRKYFTFDDFANLSAAKQDPEGFVEDDEPVTFDEVQKCPEILTAINMRVDSKRNAGHFILSGSANLSMMKGVWESLAGRAVYYTLHPFTRREISGRIDEKPFIRVIFETGQVPHGIKAAPIQQEDVLLGGMPSVCLKKIKNKALWFKKFEQTYLERDVRELSQIGNIVSFRHLLHLTALRTGQLLSPSQLGREAKLNAVTTSRYLSLLEASFVVYRLNPYLTDKTSRLIKSPKIYMSDSGLACYFTGIDDLDSDPLKGAMFETYVAQNIKGIIDSTWPEARLFFWNVQGRYEVDFVIEEGRKCIALEVKASGRLEDKDIAGLKAFISSTPHCTAAILAYNGKETIRLGERIWAVPISLVLS